MSGFKVELELPKLNEECKVYADSFAIARWPEFIAFCQRLGVDLSRPYFRMVIDLDFHQKNTCRVLLDQRPSDSGPKLEPIETTNIHNEQWRTFAPASMPEVVTEVCCVNGELEVKTEKMQLGREFL